MCLDLSTTPQTDSKIRRLVQAGTCVCCEKNPIYRNGQCRECDLEFERICAEKTPADAAAYRATCVRKGLRLPPYAIRKYKRAISILRKLA